MSQTDAAVQAALSVVINTATVPFDAAVAVAVDALHRIYHRVGIHGIFNHRAVLAVLQVATLAAVIAVDTVIVLIIRTWFIMLAVAAAVAVVVLALRTDIAGAVVGAHRCVGLCAFCPCRHGGTSQNGAQQQGFHWCVHGYCLSANSPPLPADAL